MRQEVINLYKKYGIDVQKAIDKLKEVPISIQCWQLDDIDGFFKQREFKWRDCYNR